MTPTSHIDCKGIQEEYGFTQHTAYKIMQHLPKVDLKPEIKKVYVRRADLERYLNERERAA